MKVQSDIPLISELRGSTSLGKQPFSIDFKGGEVVDIGIIANSRRVAKSESMTKLNKGFHH
jgi:hypothetical protein